MAAQAEWLLIQAVAVALFAYAVYTFYNLSNALGDSLRDDR